MSRRGVFRVTEIDEREKKLLAVDVESLYRKYGPMVLRRCRSLLLDEEQALDAMQETFVKLIRYRERLTDKAPSSMLYCIATNVCLNMMRSSRRRPQSAGDDALDRIASSEDVEARVLDRHLLDSIFGRERASTRTMAVLHYVDGMTLEEVAKHVGLSVSGGAEKAAPAQGAHPRPGGGVAVKRISDLLLEQYVLGELPPEVAGEVREELARVSFPAGPTRVNHQVRQGNPGALPSVRTLDSPLEQGSGKNRNSLWMTDREMESRPPKAQAEGAAESHPAWSPPGVGRCSWQSVFPRLPLSSLVFSFFIFRERLAPDRNQDERPLPIDRVPEDREGRRTSPPVPSLDGAT